MLLAACNPLDAKTKAGLQVITGERSASLFLDGQYLEKTPFIGKDIKPGTYTLRIQPDDSSLVPYEVNVNLRKGLLTVVTWMAGERPELSGGVIYEMEKLPGRGRTEIAVVSIPDGAIVSLQGRDKEFAPLTMTDIEPGQKEYEVSLPSYEAQRHTINILAGHKTTITVKLAKSEIIDINTVAAPMIATDSAGVTPGLQTGATDSSSNSRLASISAQTAPSSTSGIKTVGNGSKVTIQSTNYYENQVEVLKVRDAASVNGTVMGTAQVGDQYVYLQESFDGWHKIQFGNLVGWVSGQYAKISE